VAAHDELQRAELTIVADGELYVIVVGVSNFLEAHETVQIRIARGAD
jgi:hypothetical protein